MATIAPNASHHYTVFGIKGEDLAEDKVKLAQPLVGIRQTDFEDGNEIESETDEGHTGVANLDMGSYRKSAESAPSWEDGLRYGQGLEDYMYLLLGTVETTNPSTAVYNHIFSMPPNVDKDLPVATIYHGFSKTATDARIFNNSMLNECECTLSGEDLPKINPTFVSDYNIVNCINPTRNFLEDHLARTVMAQHTSVYIGEVGETLEQMLERDPIDCFTEASWNVNNNAESQSCHGDDFGVNTKTMGARELTGSIGMPWVDRTKYFETEYECYEKYGHIVSELITQKQVVYKCEGGSIIRTSTDNTLGDGETIVKEVTVDEVTTYYINTGKAYKTIFIFPVVEVTKVTSTKSGSEAKEVTFEWKGIEQPTQSFMIVNMTTDLPAPHIDNVGTTRQSFYPPLKDDQDRDINTEFAPFANQ